MVLIKLQLHASNCDLAVLFLKWIEAMDIWLSFLITWPNREALQKTMSFCVHPNYGLKVTYIIDCSELFIEKPSNLFAKSYGYKLQHTLHHKKSSTLFQKDGVAYSASDKYIVENSELFCPGDVILADRGFYVADCVIPFL